MDILVVETFLKEGEKPSIDFCERMHERGYAAVINDGNLLGFREEKMPPDVSRHQKALHERST